MTFTQKFSSALNYTPRCHRVGFSQLFFSLFPHSVPTLYMGVSVLVVLFLFSFRFGLHLISYNSVVCYAEKICTRVKVSMLHFMYCRLLTHESLWFGHRIIIMRIVTLYTIKSIKENLVRHLMTWVAVLSV